MFSGYVVVALLAAALNGWAATADLTGARMARDNAAKVGVPASWLLPLGGLKAAGAVGLLVGIAVPASAWRQPSVWSCSSSAPSSPTSASAGTQRSHFRRRSS